MLNPHAISVMSPFKGENDIEEYLSNFEVIANSLGWEQDVMAKLIHVYMNEEAREIIKGIPDDERTYESIKKALIEEFGTTEEEYFEKFNSAKLEIGMKPKVFAANLEKWLVKGLPDVDREKREKKNPTLIKLKQIRNTLLLNLTQRKIGKSW